jgi:photosystem II stability/assembly factor-like uncharacterized protein
MYNPQKLMRYAIILGVLIAAGCATTTVIPIASSTAPVTSLLPTRMPPTATSNPTTTVSPTAASNPTAAPSPAATGSLVLSSLHMVSATSGWATGQSLDKNASGVFHTDDGGAHWQNVSPANSPDNLPWAFFADASNAPPLSRQRRESRAPAFRSQEPAGYVSRSYYSSL